jgi:hypothetical protein
LSAQGLYLGCLGQNSFLSFPYGDDLDLGPTESGRGHPDQQQQAGDGVGAGGCDAAGLGVGLLDPR